MFASALVSATPRTSLPCTVNRLEQSGHVKHDRMHTPCCAATFVFGTSNKQPGQ